MATTGQAQSYAEPSDIFGIGGYLRDVNPPTNMQVMQIFIADASRLVDELFGQFFWDDGYYTRYFTGLGNSFIESPDPFFGSAGTIGAAGSGATSLTYTPSTFAPHAPVVGDTFVVDVGASRETVAPSAVSGPTAGAYTLTVPATSFTHAANTLATCIQVKIAYFENQPQASWIAELDGDGWTPPTNYYLWPRRPHRIGSALDNTAMKPWWGIDIAHIPISATTYLPTTIPGYGTAGITAHWGWPVVPDLVKDLTCKIAVKLFRRRQAGGDNTAGSDQTGKTAINQLLDPMDLMLVKESGLKVVYV